MAGERDEASLDCRGKSRSDPDRRVAGWRPERCCAERYAQDCSRRPILYSRRPEWGAVGSRRQGPRCASGCASPEIWPAAEHHSSDVGRPAVRRRRHSRAPADPRLYDAQAQSDGRRGHIVHADVFATVVHADPSAAMTGQIPVRNGMYKVGFPIEFKGLSKNTTTIASALSKAGYETAFFGKWHLG